jgi:cytochrome b561
MSTHPSSRYTNVAIALHWAMAAAIAALAAMGLVMTHLKPDPMTQFKLYQLHKSIGITVLLLAIIRLGWRLFKAPPELPQDMSAAERATASGVHWLLYAFLLALPLSGWAVVSASPLNIPTVLFNIVPWPDLPVLSSLADKRPVEALLKLVHAYGAYALLAVAGLHAAAALRHHFLLKDDVLARMLPKFKGTSR